MRNFAMVLVVIIGFTAMPARAWDSWPCEVLLCMANPAGPTAASACVPPIKKLWREMAKPRFRMPRCVQVNAPSTQQLMRDLQLTSTNRQDTNYDAGMTDSTPLPASTAVARIVNSTIDPCYGGREQVTTTNEFGMIVGSECRGPLLGYLLSPNPLGGSDFRIPVYEGYRQNIYSGTAVDIYINGALWHRVRSGPDESSGISYYGTSAEGAAPFGAMPSAPAALIEFTQDSLPPNSVLTQTEPVPHSGT